MWITEHPDKFVMLGFFAGVFMGYILWGIPNAKQRPSQSKD